MPCIQRMLESLGYSVTARTSSIEALELFRASSESLDLLMSESFDLLMIDMMMPNMTWDKLAEQVNALKPGFPIVMLSGYSDTVSPDKLESIGIQRFLMKPVGRRKLGDAVRDVLDGSDGLVSASFSEMMN